MAFNSMEPETHFKKVGLGFVAITLILLVIVMYMALSRATIIIEPNAEVLSADLLVTVRSSVLRPGDIGGRVEGVIVSRESSFSSSGEGEEVLGKAGGPITIYNNTNSNQILIATTRFLSKDGVLFRLKKDVAVPSKGSVTGEVFADKEGPGGEVSAGHFTIPGLQTALQKDIYGETIATMVGGKVKIASISQKDIDDAEDSLRESLLTEAKAGFEKTLAGVGGAKNIIFKDSILSKESNVKVGDEVGNFKLKMEIEVVAVAYSNDLKDQALKTLENMVPSNRLLLSSNIEELNPILEKYDLEDGSANLKVELLGETVINENSPLLDKDKLTGKTLAEVKAYLEKYTSIENVEIKFFPFWLKKVPKLKDHIKIIVK